MIPKQMFGKYMVTSHSESIKNDKQRMTVDMHHLPGADLLNQFEEHGWVMECAPVLVPAQAGVRFCIWFVSNTPDPTQPRPVNA